MENFAEESEKKGDGNLNPMPFDDSAVIVNSAESLEIQTQTNESLVGLPFEELVAKLEEVLASNKLIENKQNVDLLKIAFYKRVQLELEDLKKEFIKNNPEILPEDFMPPVNPMVEKFKELLKTYKNRKEEIIRAEERVRQDNLAAKREILEELQKMIRGEETLTHTYHEFQDLQRKWREIGLVPPSEAKQLWNDYNFHVQNFYEWVKLNNEARDFDLKRNLELKLRLCEQAEELSLEPSLAIAFEKLQILHEQWRDVGPVEYSKKEEIWDRFKNATKVIHVKRQEFFDLQKEELQKNYVLKLKICDKMDEIQSSKIEDMKHLTSLSLQVNHLEKRWKEIGMVSKEVNLEIWHRFKTSMSKFYERKNNFYREERDVQLKNYDLKKEIINKTKDLSHTTTDWKQATSEVLKLQKEWKEIGPIANNKIQPMWKEFRAACDLFFKKKEAHFANLKSETDANLEKKKELIASIVVFEITDDEKSNLQAVKEFQRQWMAIGSVSHSEREGINVQYKKAIDRIYASLKIEPTKKENLHFQNKVDNLKQGVDPKRKLELERSDIKVKIQKLEAELITWENNIGFFANSKNAEILIKEIQDKISAAREQLKNYREKIKAIDLALRQE